MGEILIKVVLTIVFACLTVVVWRSHIDPRATFHALLNKLNFVKDANVIATRDPNKLYQGGKTVAEVIGPFDQSNAGVTFDMLANSSALRKDQTFEWRRVTLRIVSVGSYSGSATRAGPGTPAIHAQDVLQNVICETVR